MFDPKKNGIDLISGIKSLYNEHRHSDVEFWTDAECLLIPTKFRTDLIDIFEKATMTKRKVSND